jgi:hypothetical protein
MLRMRIEGRAVSSKETPEIASSSVLLSKAVGIYQRLKGVGRLEASRREVGRSCGCVIDACGSSIARVFGPVHLVAKFVASELG